MAEPRHAAHLTAAETAHLTAAETAHLTAAETTHFAAAEATHFAAAETAHLTAAEAAHSATAEAAAEAAGGNGRPGDDDHQQRLRAIVIVLGFIAGSLENSGMGRTLPGPGT